MSQRFALEKSVTVLGQGTAKDLIVGDDAPGDVLVALAANAPFPDRTIDLAAGQLKLDGGDRIVLGGADVGSVSFDAKAEGGLLISADPAQILAPISLADPLGGALALPAAADHRFLSLRWGYDLGASAKAGLAFGGGGQLSVSADGRSSGVFAVIRQVATDAPSRDALASLVAAWRLPRQVRSADDLPPGTWLIAEVDGSLGLQLGVGYSYGLSWLRETAAGGLRGDIGLRAEAGLKASLGFKIAGRFALVIDRASTDSGQLAVRLRVYRQRVKGWDFGLDAGITARADAGPFAQSSLDGLIRGVFGIHAEQLLDDLSRFLAADPETLLVAPVKKLIEKVTGEELGGAIATVDKARAELTAVVAKIDALRDAAPNLVERLWAQLDDSTAVEAVRSFAGRITALPDPTAIRDFVRAQIERGGFLDGPAGTWLSTAAGDRLVDLLTSDSDLARLTQLAQKTLDILDGGPVQALAGRLRSEIDRIFHLDAVQAALDKAIAASDPAQLDSWLVARFQAFLGETKLEPLLGDLQRAIQSLVDRGEAIYQKSLAAVQRQVEVHVVATYQSQRQDTALLDLVFDFAPRGRALAASSRAQLEALLAAAIRGRFDQVLSEQAPGFTIQVATLTHEISRQRRIDITLPFGWQKIQEVNRGFASLEVTDDDGRVLLYEGTGDDDVAVATAKVQRDSSLSIVASLPVVIAGTGQANADDSVRLHRRTTLHYSYSFNQSIQTMGQAQLEHQLAPWVDQLFRHRFPTDGPQGSTGSFEQWLDDVDAAVEAVVHNGAGNLGDTLLSLEVGVPDGVGAAWLAAPPAGDPAYLTLSINLQRTLRRLIRAIYFAEPQRYGENAGFALLAYLAIEPSAATSLHWDFRQPAVYAAAIGDVAWRTNLEGLRIDILRMARSTQGLAQLAADYANGAGLAQRVRGLAFVGGLPRPQLAALLASEASLIRIAARAGSEIADFQASAAGDLGAARKALANFAADLAKAFNGAAKNVYVKGALRPLGSLLYAAAAQAFDPSLELDTSAVLRLSFLRPGGVPFPPAGFPPQHPALVEGSPVVNQQILVD